MVGTYIVTKFRMTLNKTLSDFNINNFNLKPY